MKLSMSKILKISLVVIGGAIGTCIALWTLATTADSLQEASSRGGTFGVILGIALFTAIGAGIVKYFKGK